MSGKPNNPASHAGHRERLRDRFLNAGADALADYELLELILFTALPRVDTKATAKALLVRFGSFAAVISAEPQRLEEVKGIGRAGVVALKAVQAAALAYMRDEIMDQPILSSWDKLLRYCKASMGHSATEQFRILFLNNKNALIADEVQQKGTVDQPTWMPGTTAARRCATRAAASSSPHTSPRLYLS